MSLHWQVAVHAAGLSVGKGYVGEPRPSAYKSIASS
jgi:hypothetical protein